MFIHIGNDNVIRSREVIAIIDYDLYANASGMYQMIQEWKQKDRVSGPEKKGKIHYDYRKSYFFQYLIGGYFKKAVRYFNNNQ